MSQQSVWPIVSDVLAIVILSGIVLAFMEGRIFSAKSLEKVTVAIGVEIASRLEKGIIAQFDVLGLREERILNAVMSIRDSNDLHEKMNEVVGGQMALASKLDTDRSPVKEPICE